MDKSLYLFIYQLGTVYTKVADKIASKKSMGKDYHCDLTKLRTLRAILFYLKGYTCEEVSPERLEWIKQFAIRESEYRILDVPCPEDANIILKEDCCQMNIHSYLIPCKGSSGTGGNAVEVVAQEIVRSSDDTQWNLVTSLSNGQTFSSKLPDHNELYGIDLGTPQGEVSPKTYAPHYQPYVEATIGLSTPATAREKGTVYSPPLAGVITPNDDAAILGLKSLSAKTNSVVSTLTLPNQNNSFSMTAPSISDTTEYTYQVLRTGKSALQARVTVPFYFPFYFITVDEDFFGLSNGAIETAVKASAEKRILGKSNIFDSNFNGLNKRMAILALKAHGMPLSIRDEDGTNIMPAFLQDGSPRTLTFNFPGFAGIEYYLFVNSANLSLINRKIDLLYFPL